jgi:hypothetical protein
MIQSSILEYKISSINNISVILLYATLLIIYPLLNAISFYIFIINDSSPAVILSKQSL